MQVKMTLFTGTSIGILSILGKHTIEHPRKNGQKLFKVLSIVGTLTCGVVIFSLPIN